MAEPHPLRPATAAVAAGVVAVALAVAVWSGEATRDPEVTARASAPGGEQSVAVPSPPPRVGIRVRIDPPNPAVAPSPPALPRPAVRPGRLLGAEGDPRAQAALALIPYPWRELGYDILWTGPRPGRRAAIRPELGRIEIHARPGDPVELIAFDIAHELGHALDFAYGTPARRARWRALRGIPQEVPWFGCAGCPDLETPAGDYAEVFAYEQTGLAGAFASRLAPLPSAAELERLRPLLRPPGG